MAFEQLTADEQEIVRQCMVFILETDHIEHPEFATRLGIPEEELQQVLAAWPNLDDTDPHSISIVAINNCLNEVCHGLFIPESQWGQWFTDYREAVRAVYAKWLRLSGAQGG